MLVRIIANPTAGGGRGGARARELDAELRKRGLDTRLCETAKAGDAKEFAGEPGADCLAVVGGDGTLNEVVNGLPSGGAPLAILTAGTANVVARQLDMPREPAALAELIASGSSRPMDVLVSGERRFLLGAGAGLDAAIAAEVKASRGARSSLWAWIRKTLRILLFRDWSKTRVLVDGEVVCEATAYVIVGNCRYSAGVFPATRRAKTDDGLLDVILAKKLSIWRMPLFALAVWLPSFPERSDILYRQGKEVELAPASEPPAALQIDGDPAGHVPARITILPGAVRVVRDGARD